MQAASKFKLQELESIITKIPLELCSFTVLPEFYLGWRDVSSAVQKQRLPMTSRSVATVLCQHARATLTDEDVDELLSRMRLKLVATQERKWHVINLREPIAEEISVAYLIQAVPGRIARVLKKSRAGRTMQPEVQSVLLGDLLYISARMVSEYKQGATLFLATPPGEPVALVSSVKSGLLKGCVEGLGYKTFEDANLHGRSIKSLLRINDRAWTENADHLANTPEYNPVPIITNDGIDYTYKDYDKQYVDEIIGPDPPLLTEITITTSKPFFDPTKLNKTINVTMGLKSDDLSKTLKAWVAKRALPPTSDLLHIYKKVKSNKFAYED